MSLRDELQSMAARSRAKRPPEVTASMERALRELAASGIVEQSLKVGETAPEFTLPNAYGEPVALAELLARGPLVVSFYRGGWCPYCNLELRYLQRYLPRFRELGADLVAISPELPDVSLETVEQQQLSFEVLSDVGNEVARRFGLVFRLDDETRERYQRSGYDLPGRTGSDSYELPIPATYLLEPSGRVALAFVDVDYAKRLDPEEILAALEARETTF